MNNFSDLLIGLKSHQELVLLFTLLIMSVYGGFRLALDEIVPTKTFTKGFVFSILIIPLALYFLGLPSANAALAITIAVTGSRNIFHLLLRVIR